MGSLIEQKIEEDRNQLMNIHIHLSYRLYSNTQFSKTLLSHKKIILHYKFNIYQCGSDNILNFATKFEVY